MDPLRPPGIVCRSYEARHTPSMRYLVGFILGMAVAVVAEAQVAPTQPAKEDPLGRSTPRSTLVLVDTSTLRQVESSSTRVSTAIPKVPKFRSITSSIVLLDLASFDVFLRQQFLS